MEAVLVNKFKLLKEDLKKMKKVAIAYSGGVDSNFLLKVAKDVLGENVVAITINAMMHSKREINEAKDYAKDFGVNHLVINISDIKIKEFTQNGPLRCYYCKKFIFTKIKEIANEHNIEYVLDGTNLSDLSDYRPGIQALEELNIISPLKNVKLTKEEIRILSKELKLDTYKKPSFSCLATRIPVDIEITDEKLRMIETAENFLQDNGFNQYRVRLHENIARIEVDKGEIHKFFNEEIIKSINLKFKEIGFKHVTLDLEGYQMGSMN